MMYGKMLSLEYWRNYVPYAPDLEVVARTGQPLEINLRDWSLQGARDPETFTSPDPEVLSKIPVQRGWRLNPIVAEPPSKGFVSIDTGGPSLIYTSRSGYLGPDCFTYVLSNGTQRSLMAQISIEVIRWYGSQFTDLRREDGKYSVDLTTYQPASEPTPLFTHFAWYWKDFKYVDDSSGKNRVYSRDKLLYKTQYESNYTTGHYPRMIDRANKYYDFEIESDADLMGFDGDSDVPYRPTKRPYTLVLVQKNYFNHRTRRYFGGYRNGVPYYYNVNIGLDYSKYDEYTFEITADYGDKWWESGNIREINNV